MKKIPLFLIAIFCIPIVYAQTWEFNTPGNTEGWLASTATKTSVIQTTSINGVDGVLTLNDAVLHNDPQLIIENIELDRTKYSAWDSVEIRIRQLYATGNDSNPWNSGGTLLLSVPGPVNLKTITQNEIWNITEQSNNWITAKADISSFNVGTLTSLRFDPIGGETGIGKNFEIDYIRLSARELIPVPSLENATMGKDSMNVIFILIDDMGWKDLGCYGSDFFESPKIDDFAETAMRFTNAYAASPLCSPTRASVLTGQNPGKIGFFNAAGHLPNEILQPSEKTTAQAWYPAAMPQTITRLPNDYVTFAEVFKALDYSTAFMGKWHMGHEPYVPENQGFDLVIGGREHAGPPGPGNYFSPWDCSTLPIVPDGEHICDVLTDEAISYITKKKDDPFMLCLWYYDVHGPWMAKEELKNKYDEKLTDNHIQRSPTMGGMIETLDENVGRLMQAIENLNLDENTIVILTSDNGGNMYSGIDGEIPTNNYPLRGCKGNNHEGGVRVPLIIRAPGVTKPNTSSGAIISTVDHYPTLLEMLDITIPLELDMDGESFVNALKGEDYERTPLYSAFFNNTPATGNVGNMSVRKGDWKLYKFYYESNAGKHHYELFNLKDDLSENDNLAELMPEKVAELSTLIEERIAVADIKEPQINTNYKGNTADVWIGSENTEISIVENAIHIVASGKDPGVETVYVPKISPGTYNVHFKIKSTATGGGKMSWTTSSSKTFNENNSVSFNVVHDGKWHSFSLPIALDASMQRLRIQAAGDKGIIDVRDIEMTTLKGHYIREWPLTFSPIRMEVSSEGDVKQIEGLGKKLQLFAKNRDGENVDVEWSVDNSHATIDENGVLTTKSKGDVIIISQETEGGNRIASFKLKVIDPDEISAINIRSEGNFTEVNGIGSTLQFYAENSSNGNSADVDWSVSNARIASINEDGILTAAMVGTINLIATLKTNSSVNSTFSLTITNDNTGIAKPSREAEVNVFTNPLLDNIFIEIPECLNNASVDLFNIEGKLLFKKSNLHSGINQISTEGLIAGLYLFHITSNRETVIKKMLLE